MEEEAGRIHTNYRKNTKSTFRQDPRKNIKTYPGDFKAWKVSTTYAGYLILSKFESNMDPKESGGQKPPPSFGSGLRPSGN